MSLLGKNITANLLSNVWLAALLLVLTPVYVRLLGVESYGLIGFYQSWVAILAILDTGISTAAGREIAWLSARDEERGRIPTFTWSVELAYWFAVLLLGGVLMVACWRSGETWLNARELRPETVRTALLLMTASLVLQTPAGLYVAGLMGLQRQAACAGLLLIFGTVRGVGAVLVLLLIGPDIRLFFCWQIVASALQTGYMRWFTWRIIGRDHPPAHFSRASLDSVKHFAGGVIVITALNGIMTQTDKVVLSRMVSLEALGAYMLAWSVALSLARIAMPIVHSFAPRFTQLVSTGNDTELARSRHIAAQLMSALILPPAALLAFLAKPVLAAWIGRSAVATSAAPILVVVVVGSALVSCSYPPMLVLYSKKQLRPVITVNLACVLTLLPLMLFLVTRFGAIGAAVCWALYGLTVFVAFQVLAEPGARVIRTFAFDFLLPAAVAVTVAAAARQSFGNVSWRPAFFALLALALLLSWACALLSCTTVAPLVIGITRRAGRRIGHSASR